MKCEFTETEKQEWLAAQQAFWDGKPVQYRYFRDRNWTDGEKDAVYLDHLTFYRPTPSPLEASDLLCGETVFVRLAPPFHMNNPTSYLVIGIEERGGVRIQRNNGRLEFISFGALFTSWEIKIGKADWAAAKKVAK